MASKRRASKGKARGVRTNASSYATRGEKPFLAFPSHLSVIFPFLAALTLFGCRRILAWRNPTPHKQFKRIGRQIADFAFRNFPVNRTGTRKKQEGQGSSIPGVLERRDSNNVPARPQSAEPLPFPKESTTSQSRALGLASVEMRRQRPQLEDTQEQLVAVARGGVRYAGKVFHRKGVKLTEDSPRSMLPCNVSQYIGHS